MKENRIWLILCLLPLALVGCKKDDSIDKDIILSSEEQLACGNDSKSWYRAGKYEFEIQENGDTILTYDTTFSNPDEVFFILKNDRNGTQFPNLSPSNIAWNIQDDTLFTNFDTFLGVFESNFNIIWLMEKEMRLRRPLLNDGTIQEMLLTSP